MSLSVGIIGCGNIAATYLRLAPLFAGLKIVAVADLNPEAAEARAVEYGVDAMAVDALLNSETIDLVLNLTIPAAHFEVSKSALDARKHVYSEKPFVLSLEEGLALRSLAAEKGLRVGSAPDTFLGGAAQLARARIDAGLIGDVVAGTAAIMGHGMEHWHPNPDFFYQPGAGPVLDMGPYYLTTLVHLLGPVARVAALATNPTPMRTLSADGPRKGEAIPVETPTNVQALLSFASGATVPFLASWDVWAHRHGPMELYGTNGALFLPDPNFFGGDVQHAGRDGAVTLLADGDHPFAQANEPGNRANYRVAGLADMAQAITEGRPHRCGLDLARHVVEVMTGILEAGEAGRWVAMTTKCARPAPLDGDAALSLLVNPGA